MSVGGIPFVAIHLYAERYGIDDFDTFHALIRALDSEYLAHANRSKPTNV